MQYSAHGRHRPVTQVSTYESVLETGAYGFRRMVKKAHCLLQDLNILLCLLQLRPLTRIVSRQLCFTTPIYGAI